MDSASLEQALRDLPKVGQLVQEDGLRQIWRFEHGGRGYWLTFFPRERFWWKRLLRGNPAMREFTHLQSLQKAGIASPRARSVLIGYRIEGRLGNALITDAIEPSVPLDKCLNDLELHGQTIADRPALARQLTDLVLRLGEAGLGHSDLRLGSFLLHEGALFLRDASALRHGGLKTTDVLRLGSGVARYATRGDLLRGWNVLSHGAPMPRRNPRDAKQRGAFLGTINGENDHFGKIDIDGWRGLFFKHAQFPRRWSKASQMRFTHADWQRGWPELMRRIERDQLTIIKRGPGGDVLAGTIEIAGQSLEIIVKRPQKRLWHRYLTTIIRPGRARRMWLRAWRLYAGNFMMEWPLILMEKRICGYVTDAIIVFEKMSGDLLAKMDLNSLDGKVRQTLFHRLGRILRQIDEQRMSHTDAKAYNWIIQRDEAFGPLPIMIDVDSIREHTWGAGKGIQRLLRGMEEHPQYTPEDSLSLCRGFAPKARMAIQSCRHEAEQPAAAKESG